MSEYPLSPQQRKLLKKVTHLLPLDEYGKTDREIILGLCEQGLIDHQEPFLYITEKGKAALSQYRYTILTDWFPIVISSIALIISIIALVR